MKILIINGPNMNMLGIREPEIYGSVSYNQLCKIVEEYASEHSISTEFYQSNHEGSIVDKIQSAYGVFDGIVINPAAYTHTSIAIRDAIAAVGIPTVSVHISDINSREDFRKTDFIKDVCFDNILGLGINGYIKAIEILVNKYENRV